MRISLANDSTREQTWRQKDLEIQSLLSAVGFWGEIFSSRLKSFNSCVPRFSFFFFKSRFFTSLLLRFSGEVDVLSQVVWAVKCNLLSVASSNMYSTHNISPLSLSLACSPLFYSLSFQLHSGIFAWIFTQMKLQSITLDAPQSGASGGYLLRSKSVLKCTDCFCPKIIHC